MAVGVGKGIVVRYIGGGYKDVIYYVIDLFVEVLKYDGWWILEILFI